MATIQDKISTIPAILREQLQSFVRVDPKFYEDIEIGSFVRYITHEGKFRFGGKVVINQSPEFLVLKNDGNLRWSINLNNNIIFLKDRATVDREQVEKDNLYKLYKAGYVEINIPDK